jgi:4-alpha-glucanotransferase
VPEGLREAMHAAGILGCRVAVFETDGWTGGFRDPAHWDAEVLASFATHDLPTWKGWRKGRDIDWRARTGAAADAAAETDARARDIRAFDAAVGGAPGDAGAMHGFLARSASRLVAVQAEDLLDLDEQANLPGTVHEHPNWRRRLPVGPDELEGDARLAALSRLMESCGRQGDPQ